LGIAWVPFCPLGSAFDGWAKVTDVPAVRAHAARLAITPAQAGLAWLLRHSPRTLLIPGTSSVDHLAENVDTARIALDARAVVAFDRAAGCPDAGCGETGSQDLASSV
jgi:aryl-alcohol dehydrogenase-like predicted oxidoreductase